MNPLNQGDISGSSTQPAKRKRGRPRKDSSLKPAEPTHTPVAQGVKEYVPQRNDGTMGIECMTGEPVTGVVEATFDAGYMLCVKIGNSYMRGVVFKPGYYRPVTPDIDIAPHLPMIRANNVLFTAEKDRPMTVKSEHIKVEDGKEALKSSTEGSGIGSTPKTEGTDEPLPAEASHPDPAAEPSFDDRLTELLKVLQENVDEDTKPDASNGAGVP